MYDIMLKIRLITPVRIILSNRHLCSPHTETGCYSDVSFLYVINDDTNIDPIFYTLNRPLQSWSDVLLRIMGTINLLIQVPVSDVVNP